MDAKISGSEFDKKQDVWRILVCLFQDINQKGKSNFTVDKPGKEKRASPLWCSCQNAQPQFNCEKTSDGP